MRVYGLFVSLSPLLFYFLDILISRNFHKSEKRICSPLDFEIFHHWLLSRLSIFVLSTPRPPKNPQPSNRGSFLLLREQSHNSRCHVARPHSASFSPFSWRQKPTSSSWTRETLFVSSLPLQCLLNKETTKPGHQDSPRSCLLEPFSE